jgi:DNA-binding CsgD family transcriptional regulator
MDPDVPVDTDRSGPPDRCRRLGRTDPREREVLELIAGRMSNAAIAAKFRLTISTVINHISSISPGSRSPPGPR